MSNSNSRNLAKDSTDSPTFARISEVGIMNNLKTKQHGESLFRPPPHGCRYWGLSAVITPNRIKKQKKALLPPQLEGAAEPSVIANGSHKDGTLMPVL